MPRRSSGNCGSVALGDQCQRNLSYRTIEWGALRGPLRFGSEASRRPGAKRAAPATNDEDPTGGAASANAPGGGTKRPSADQRCVATGALLKRRGTHVDQRAQRESSRMLITFA